MNIGLGLCTAISHGMHQKALRCSLWRLKATLPASWLTRNCSKIRAVPGMFMKRPNCTCKKILASRPLIEKCWWMFIDVYAKYRVQWAHEIMSMGWDDAFFVALDWSGVSYCSQFIIIYWVIHLNNNKDLWSESLNLWGVFWFVLFGPNFRSL